MATKRYAKSAESPDSALARFFARYSPEVATVGKEALAAMRANLPGAHQLVYDNYNALVIAFGPSERTSEVVLSIALYPRWVNLFFAHGARLPDPGKILKGSGKIVRSIKLSTAADLKRPEILALIDAALKEAGWTPNRAAEGKLIIKLVSAKQRPRRPRSA
jgi:hypothetical protein